MTAPRSIPILFAALALGCGKDAPSDKTPPRPPAPQPAPTEPKDPSAVAVTIAANGSITSPRSIDAATKLAHAATGSARCELQVDPSAMWRATLSALDQCRRAGAKALVVNGLAVTLPTAAQFRSPTAEPPSPTGQQEELVRIRTAIEVDAAGSITLDGKAIIASELDSLLTDRAQRNAAAVLVAPPNATTGTVVKIWRRIAAAKLPVSLAFPRGPTPN